MISLNQAATNVLAEAQRSLAGGYNSNNFDNVDSANATKAGADLKVAFIGVAVGTVAVVGLVCCCVNKIQSMHAPESASRDVELSNANRQNTDVTGDENV